MIDEQALRVEIVIYFLGVSINNGQISIFIILPGSKSPLFISKKSIVATFQYTTCRIFFISVTMGLNQVHGRRPCCSVDTTTTPRPSVSSDLS